MLTEKTEPVMDVTRPGKTAASATSRPIIVGHGAMIKDPMVREKGAEQATEIEQPATSQPEKLEPHAELKLSVPDDTPEKSTTSQTTAPASSTMLADDQKESAASSEETSSDVEQHDDELTDKGVVDAVVGQAGQSAKEKKKADADAAQQEAIQKLIHDKTYFVPIKQTNRKRAGGIVLLVTAMLFILLAGASYYAYKAGLINELVKKL